MQRVYIDNNVWDLAYKYKINLTSCFPIHKFALAISKHGRFEIDQIPDNEKNDALKRYIFSSLDSYVEEIHTFGFKNAHYSDHEQRVSGFGIGVFGSDLESKERKRLNKIYGGKEKRKPELTLYKQEADIELGALSMKSYVITLDKKSGPLKNASENGGKVIFLNEISTELCPKVFQLAADKIDIELLI